MSLDIYIGKGEYSRSMNITHNLADMAEAAGIFKCLWRAEENGFKRARQLIKPLESAIADMRARPEFYKQYDAPNGWGTYKDFAPWLERLLEICRENPNRSVRTWR